MSDPDFERLAGAILATRFNFAGERELQDGLEAVLKRHGFAYRREHALGPDDRPDFMVEDVAVEVKVAGSYAQVARQLHRYVRHAEVARVLLVTTRSNHTRMPETLSAKRVRVINVSRASAF